MVRHEKKLTGFTLMELLIVIAIIGLLAAIVFASLSSAREKSDVAATQAQLEQIVKAFELFYSNHGDYPPVGSDHCSICEFWGETIPPNPYWDGGYDSTAYWYGAQWSDIVNLLVADGVIGPGIVLDPWGNSYLYDKNFGQSCYTWSPICSRGPNGFYETPHCPSANSFPTAVGDDICVFIPGQ